MIAVKRALHTLSAIRYHVQWAFSDRIYVDSLSI